MNPKEALIRIVFGPKVEGTIVATRQDRNDDTIQHLLIQTDEGDKRHMMSKRQLGWEMSKNRFVLTELYYNGDRFEGNIRGKGIILLPGSKIERDPFGLKNNKVE